MTTLDYVKESEKLFVQCVQDEFEDDVDLLNELGISNAGVDDTDCKKLVENLLQASKEFADNPARQRIREEALKNKSVFTKEGLLHLVNSLISTAGEYLLEKLFVCISFITDALRWIGRQGLHLAKVFFNRCKQAIGSALGAVVAAVKGWANFRRKFVHVITGISIGAVLGCLAGAVVVGAVAVGVALTAPVSVPVVAAAAVASSAPAAAAAAGTIVGSTVLGAVVGGKFGYKYEG